VFYLSETLTDISVVAGPASIDLANNIAKRLGAQLTMAGLRIFSDGESKIKLSKVVSNNCVIVQSTHPPTDMHLIQLLMIAKKCTDYGAQHICAVIPYLGYARQDRAFLEGEVVSIGLVAKLLESVGIEHIITVDIHSELAMSYFPSIQNVSSVPLLAQYASKMKLHDPIAVSPDAGGTNRANEFARHLDIDDVVVLKKSRHRETGEVTIDEKVHRDISKRDAIMIDDIISSGNSLTKAAEVLYKNGAGRIYAMCAHALLIRDAAQKIKSAGVEDIISTNSVAGQYSKVDLSPELALAIKSRY
jgi:ribose-phosphate pyrophosphokinase